MCRMCVCLKFVFDLNKFGIINILFLNIFLEKGYIILYIDKLYEL